MMDTVRRKMKIVSHFRLPPFFARKSANTSRNPVFTKALLRIKIAPIVITAGLLNPLMASCQVRTLNKSKTPIAPMAVTSMGSISMTKNTTITSNTEISIIPSIVINIFSENWFYKQGGKVRLFEFC